MERTDDRELQELQASVNRTRAIFRRGLPEIHTAEKDYVPAESIYVDDGLKSTDLPTLELVGDIEPSVWAGIEKRSRLMRQEEQAGAELVTAQNSIKRALNKLGA